MFEHNLNLEKKIKLYPGKIIKINDDSTYFIQFDDGDTRKSCTAAELKILKTKQRKRKLSTPRGIERGTKRINAKSLATKKHYIEKIKPQIPSDKVALKNPKSNSDNSKRDLKDVNVGHSENDVPEIIKPTNELFIEMLHELDKYKKMFGGSQNFRRGQKPSFYRKVTRREYVSAYSDYEYIYLQIEGFRQIFHHSDRIISLNNHKFFTKNPGTQFLERVAGMTMHGDRLGVNAIVSSSPGTLCKCYLTVKKNGPKAIKKFFKLAFSRDSDPCLEGRVSLLLRFIEEMPEFQKEAGTVSKEGVPWADTSLDFRAKLDAKGLVGEYMRVYINLQTAQYAKDNELKYVDVKNSISLGKQLKNFEEDYCNSKLFKKHLNEIGFIKKKRYTNKKKNSNGHGPPTRLDRDQVEKIVRWYVNMDTIAE